ncbi:hypothetical protein IPZ61_13415 [Streptomyces sioyaensis]|uniref:hypothetical protein n=1 Tax=Streptomyces sioyaensis TaxID=67364 RepID=UPI001F2C5896|nr:hypothetical protein [Streptomyces sioyaensis]MCF3174313.1 hypothetical protein [Streptomyces sioyaensis]
MGDPSPGTVEGVARGVQMRTELQGGGSDRGVSTTVVCTFRIEVQDARGAPVGLVPVEMRGRSFEGSVGDGDRVRATGQVKRGTLRAKELLNLTTGAEVSAKSTPVAVVVIAVLIFIGFVIFLIVMASQGPEW